MPGNNPNLSTQRRGWRTRNRKQCFRQRTVSLSCPSGLSPERAAPGTGVYNKHSGDVPEAEHDPEADHRRKVQHPSAVNKEENSRNTR